MKQASRGRGDLYIRWERKQQQYLHRVYQNYNIHGRFVRIEVWQGSRKSAVIIPEADYNSGWVDIAEKILRLLGSHSSNGPVRPPSPLLRSYFEAAKIESWPDIPIPPSIKVEKVKHPLSRCLIGTFNDPFNNSPSTEIIQNWFLGRWKISAGLKVTPIDHNRFMFEFPSRQEAV